MKFSLLKTLNYKECAPQRNREVCFSPDGQHFGISQGYPEYTNESKFRIYNSQTFDEIKRISLESDYHEYEIHAVVLDKKYAILGLKRMGHPGPILVYSITEEEPRLISRHDPPLPHLVEVHSFHLHSGILVASYCENQSNFGAIVSHKFDSETGELSPPISIVENCFHGEGDTKGICISPDGYSLYVTFEGSKFAGGKNGYVVFPISNKGEIFEDSAKFNYRGKKCRLECVHILDDMMVIVDTLNNNVEIYKKDTVSSGWNQVQIIKTKYGTPHSAKFSPDQKTLVVTSLGHRVKKGQIQWRSWRRPFWSSARADNVYIYRQT